MSSGIYLLKFENGSTYVGKSVNIERRMEEHKKALESGKAAHKLQTAFILYGWPTCETLLECHPDHIDLMESVYMIKLQPDLNTTGPIKLCNTDIDILLQNTGILKESTAEHISMLVAVSKLNDNYMDEIDDLCEKVEELAKTRTKEELKLEVGRKLQQKIKDYEQLNKEYDSLYKEYVEAVERLKTPWWKRLFSKK